jgi:hypothetical protein
MCRARPGPRSRLVSEKLGRVTPPLVACISLLEVSKEEISNGGVKAPQMHRLDSRYRLVRLPRDSLRGTRSSLLPMAGRRGVSACPPRNTNRCGTHSTSTSHIVAPSSRPRVGESRQHLVREPAGGQGARHQDTFHRCPRSCIEWVAGDRFCVTGTSRRTGAGFHIGQALHV